jgi:hypothetical protein
MVDQAPEYSTEEDAGEERETQSSVLIKLGLKAQLFRTPNGELYAHGPVNGHRETWPVGAKFKRWLVSEYFGANERAPNPAAVNQAVTVLEGIAQFKGPVIDVFVRLGDLNGDLYLDLADDTWRSVRVGPDGWQIVDGAPIRFRRPRGQLALPQPERGGSVEELHQFLNITPDDWVLVIGWLVGCFHPVGPYPLLLLHGVRGTAKSSASRYLRSLVDPAYGGSRDAPKEMRDLAVAAKNNRVLAYDNLSSIPPWLADAFCRLATGSGFGTRALYTDDEEAIFDARRPIIINSIEEIATRGDMLDRAISTVLLSVKKRRREKEMDEQFGVARPRILGALLDVVGMALRDHGRQDLPDLPRMADFAAWVVAAEPSLGWTPGDFMTAYQRNQRESVDIEIDASTIGPSLTRFLVQRSEWTGTLSDLLAEISGLATDEAKKRKSWPANARALSGALKRIAPALQARGWSMVDKRSHGVRYVIFDCSAEGDGSGAANQVTDGLFAAPDLPFAAPATPISELAGAAGAGGAANFPLLMSHAIGGAESREIGKEGDGEKVRNSAAPPAPAAPCRSCGRPWNVHGASDPIQCSRTPEQ